MPNNIDIFSFSDLLGYKMIDVFALEHLSPPEFNPITFLI